MLLTVWINSDPRPEYHAYAGTAAQPAVAATTHDARPDESDEHAPPQWHGTPQSAEDSASEQLTVSI